MADDADDAAGAARVREAASASLGALLLDGDVAGAHAVEGGALEVIRRGRRERLEAGIDDELWAALREAGAADAPVRIDIPPHRLHASPVAGGRLLLHLAKAPATTPRLAALVEERLLPAAAADAVLRSASAGNGLLVVGPARAAARRLVIATAREVAAHAPVFSLSDGPLPDRAPSDPAADWLLPAPAMGTLVARARAAAELGAEAVLAPVLSLDEVIALARAGLPVPVFAAVDAGNLAALYAALSLAEGELSVDAVAAQVCVVGRTVDGRPTLLEHYAPPEGVASARPTPHAPHAPPSPPAARAPDAVEPGPRSIRVPALLAAPPPGEPELPALPPLPAGPPADWASTSQREEPGWDLGEPAVEKPAGADVSEPADDEGTASGGFDDVLAGMRKRPSFQPRRPPAHPQARELRGDPLGGLTLEPPPGALSDADGGEGGEGGDP